MNVMARSASPLIFISSIGIAAYMLTDVLHEVIGHGGTCLLIGQKIDLITSVYFKSSPGNFLTDIGGPVSNLLLGLVLHTILTKRNHLSPLLRFFLLNVMAYNFFWFSGTILQSGFSKTGDWTYAMAQLPVGAASKSILLVTGIIAYLLSIKITRLHANRFDTAFPGFPLKRSILYAYLGAAIAATAAGLFFSYDRTNAAFEGFLEAAGLLPMLFSLPGKRADTSHVETSVSPIIAISVLLLFIAFCFTLGSGIRFGVL